MKKSNQMVLREVAGNFVLVPFGEKAISFNGIIQLNDTAKFLWENCGDEFDEDSITQLILTSYEDVEEPTARESARKFIKTLGEVGAIG